MSANESLDGTALENDAYLMVQATDAAKGCGVPSQTLLWFPCVLPYSKLMILELQSVQFFYHADNLAVLNVSVRSVAQSQSTPKSKFPLSY